MKYLIGLLFILLSIWGCGLSNDVPSKPVKVQEIETLVLPVSALDVKHWSTGSEVDIYIFDTAEQVARRKTIQIGETVNNHVEVLSGLQEGEQVIVAGVPFLKDGQKVKRWPSTVG